MMAMLFAINIAKGRRTFAQVPKFLKDKVRECLIDMDLEHLAKEGAQQPSFILNRKEFN